VNEKDKEKGKEKKAELMENYSMTRAGDEREKNERGRKKREMDSKKGRKRKKGK